MLFIYFSRTKYIITSKESIKLVQRDGERMNFLLLQVIFSSSHSIFLSYSFQFMYNFLISLTTYYINKNRSSLCFVVSFYSLKKLQFSLNFKFSRCYMVLQYANVCVRKKFLLSCKILLTFSSNQNSYPLKNSSPSCNLFLLSSLSFCFFLSDSLFLCLFK